MTETVCASNRGLQPSSLLRWFLQSVRTCVGTQHGTAGRSPDVAKQLARA